MSKSYAEARYELGIAIAETRRSFWQSIRWTWARPREHRATRDAMRLRAELTMWRRPPPDADLVIEIDDRARIRVRRADPLIYVSKDLIEDSPHSPHFDGGTLRVAGFEYRPVCEAPEGRVIYQQTKAGKLDQWQPRWTR